MNLIKRLLNLIAGKSLYNDYQKPKRLQKINYHLNNNFFTNKNKIYTKYKIWDYSYGKPQILFDSGSFKLEIGKFCSIAWWVKIYMWWNHRYDRYSQYPFGSIFWIKIPNETIWNGSVYIWNDVRIWQDVKILSWVNIWNGAVIWMWSIVTKNVAPYSIVWWIPAKHIKYRFEQNKIDELENSQRRNQEIDWIKKNIVNIDKVFSDLKP